MVFTFLKTFGNSITKQLSSHSYESLNEQNTQKQFEKLFKKLCVKRTQ